MLDAGYSIPPPADKSQCCKIGPSATSTKLSINALRTGFGMVARGLAAGCRIWLAESSVLHNPAKMGIVLPPI